MYDEQQLSDAEIEMLIDGDPRVGDPGGSPVLVALLGELRLQPARTANVDPSPRLAEFIEVVDLPEPAGMSDLSRRRSVKKVTAGLTAGVATTAGKVLIGTALAAAAAGGAHVSEVVDVPGLPEQSKGQATLEVPELPDQSNGRATLEVRGRRGGEGSGQPQSGDNVDANSHGKAVSEFATTTDLDGCERGQAIAALASSNAADNRQNPEVGRDPCGQSAESGKPDDVGQPAESGKPGHVGQPAEPGKPD